MQPSEQTNEMCWLRKSGQLYNGRNEGCENLFPFTLETSKFLVAQNIETKNQSASSILVWSTRF